MVKKPCTSMIKYTPASERTLALFDTPFEQELSSQNRWVKMADLVPWDEMAEVFFSCLSSNHGRPTVDLRIILGALLVKHIEGLSDEDTIGYIEENIYAQYFVGLSSFSTEPVFVPSLFVEIRKRLGQKGSSQLNDILIKQARELKVVKHKTKGGKKDKPKDPPSARGPEAGNPDGSGVGDKTEGENRGTLLLDATVGPLHIAYPTDTSLLNEGRRISEQLIDGLYESCGALWKKKPRTYRRGAQKAFVGFSKKKNKSKKEIRKATGQQLRYLRRNLKTLDKMLDKLEENGKEVCWTYRQWRKLWIIQELYRQQEEMYRHRRKRIAERLVSLSQPHARPIKRGKSGGKATEFGPKINVSMSEGIARVDQIDFNAFNEANYLEEQIQGYKRLHGYYPALVLADQIYWTRSNRNYLKQRNIQIGGAPLGKPKEMSRYEKYKTRKRNNKRSEIEGKFGQGKSKYGLDDLFTRLPQTTKAEINLIFLALNLIRINKFLFGSVCIILFSAMETVFSTLLQVDQNRRKTEHKNPFNNWAKVEMYPSLSPTF